jgi:hypothetical protein
LTGRIGGKYRVQQSLRKGKKGRKEKGKQKERLLVQGRGPSDENAPFEDENAPFEDENAPFEDRTRRSYALFSHPRERAVRGRTPFDDNAPFEDRTRRSFAR